MEIPVESRRNRQRWTCSGRRGYDTFPIAHPRAFPQSARDHRAMRRLPGVTPPMRLKARMNAASDS
jgi:hypothetical protein